MAYLLVLGVSLLADTFGWPLSGGSNGRSGSGRGSRLSELTAGKRPLAFRFRQAASRQRAFATRSGPSHSGKADVDDARFVTYLISFNKHARDKFGRSIVDVANWYV